LQHFFKLIVWVKQSFTVKLDIHHILTFAFNAHLSTGNYLFRQLLNKGEGHGWGT